MRYIDLRIQTEDYPFIVEAIKLRTTALLEGLAMQVDGQRLAAQRPPEEPMAARAVRPRAKWGLKKDGTPKKRPGRPAK